MRHRGVAPLRACCLHGRSVQSCTARDRSPIRPTSARLSAACRPAEHLKMELVDSATSARRGRAARFLVARLAAELRELEQLVVSSRECLAIEERGLTDMAAGIAREAQVAEGVRSAAEDLGRTASAVAAHAAELN